MSSDLFAYDPDDDLQFMPSDLLLPFGDPTPIDSPDILLHDPIDQLSAATNYALLLSSSPPCHQLESLSLCRGVPSEFPFGLSEHSGSSFGADQEGPAKGDRSPAGPHSYGGHESGGSSSVVKYMQRSYSSHLFEEKPAAALYRPQFDAVVDSPEFQGLQSVAGSPESCFLGAQMRRVCSTGDLQRTSLTSPLGMESSFADEASMKVGRYSAEERKERILKYKVKRTQRNFTKTIKYACRKALADNRPRIRGRFARNDEVVEIPKAPCSDYDPDHLWLGLQEEEEFGTGTGGPFLGSSYGQAQYHYSYTYHIKPENPTSLPSM